MVLFTDGVTEGRRDRDFYGDARLADAISHAPADSHQLADHLLADLLSYQKATQQMTSPSWCFNRRLRPNRTRPLIAHDAFP